MAIPVEHDGEPAWECRERCCFCRAPTNHWYTPKNVACCRRCAGAASHKDVPTKKAWMRREDIAMAHTRRRT